MSSPLSSPFCRVGDSGSGSHIHAHTRQAVQTDSTPKTSGAVAAPRESEVLNNPLYTPAAPAMNNPLHQDAYVAAPKPTGDFLTHSGGGDGVLKQGGGGGLAGGIDAERLLDSKGGGGLAGGIDAFFG